MQSYQNLNNLLIENLKNESNFNELAATLIHFKRDLCLNLSNTNDSTIKDKNKFLQQMLQICDEQPEIISLNDYFLDRNLLLDSLEIIIRYSDFQNHTDPIEIINRICKDIIMNSNLIDNIISIMINYSQHILNLLPQQNESTTTLRQELLKAGLSELEIDDLILNLKREIDVLGLILSRISIKFGLKYNN